MLRTAVLFALPSLCLAAQGSGAGQPPWRSIEGGLQYAPEQNPLKGFVPYAGKYDLPHSLEFSYIGLDEVMHAPGKYDFQARWEPLLEEISSRGHQAIFRLFIDYPNKRLALPQYFIEAGIPLTPYDGHGGGQTPDYDFPPLVDALEGLIAELGSRYDGDPRIGYLQIGLLGHWGEWHTWPQDHLFPSVETQNRLLAAYDSAFDRTHLLVSQDAMGGEPMPRLRTYRIGFHDDAFAEGTLGPDDWMFYPRLVAHGMSERWRQHPVGGEVLPDLQDNLLRDPVSLPQRYEACLRAVRPTWLLNHYPFMLSAEEAEQRRRAIAFSKMLGYELVVQDAHLEGAPPGTDVAVRLENIGRAPFPYDWPLVLQFIGASGQPLEVLETDWRVTQLQPDSGTQEWWFRAPISLPAEAGAEMRLLLPNALSGAPPVRFANRDQNDNGVLLWRQGDK